MSMNLERLVNMFNQTIQSSIDYRLEAVKNANKGDTGVRVYQRSNDGTFVNCGAWWAISGVEGGDCLGREQISFFRNCNSEIDVLETLKSKLRVFKIIADAGMST